MSSGRTSVFIELPRFCTTVEVMVVPTEPISKLIERVLKSFDLEPDENVGLFGKSYDFKLFKSDDLCEKIFTSNCSSYVLQPIGTKTLIIYYENRPSKINYRQKMNLSQVMAIAADCFCLDINSNYIIAVDPITNCICKMNQEINSDILVLIKLNVFSIDMVFDLKSFVNFDGSIYLLTLSKLMLSNQMKNLFSLVRSRRNEKFSMKKLDKNEIKECLKNFMDDNDLSSFEPDVQNALLFILISSSPKPLFPEKLHEMAIETVDLNPDTLKMEKIIALLSYLPLSSYFLLMELVQIFGGILCYEETRRASIQLITEVFFPNKINRDYEIKFISFLLMYFQILFRFPQRGNREFLIDKNDKVYVTEYIDEKRVIYTEDGESNIDYDNTMPFNFKPDIEVILDKFADKRKNEIQDVTDDLKLLNNEIENVYNLINNYFKEYGRISLKNIPKKFESQSFLPFDFSNYALSELPKQIISEVSPIIIDNNDSKTDPSNSKVFSFDSALLEPSNNVESPVKRRKISKMKRRDRVRFKEASLPINFDGPPPLASTPFDYKKDQNTKPRKDSLKINSDEQLEIMNSLNNFGKDEDDSLDEFTEQNDFTETDYSSFSTLPDLSQTSFDNSVIANNSMITNRFMNNYENEIIQNDSEKFDVNRMSSHNFLNLKGFHSESDDDYLEEEYYNSYSVRQYYSGEEEEEYSEDHKNGNNTNDDDDNEKKVNSLEM